MKKNYEINKNLLYVLNFSINNYKKRDLFGDLYSYGLLQNYEFEYINMTNYEDNFNSLFEIINYTDLRTIVINMFKDYRNKINERSYGSFYSFGKYISVSENIDFNILSREFSTDDLFKLLIMNELIHEYNLTKEFLYYFSKASDLNQNIYNSVVYIVKNYDIFSLRFLKMSMKDNSYKERQVSKAYNLLDMIIGDQYLELMQKLSNNIDVDSINISLDKHIDKLDREGPWYDYSLIIDFIYIVGIKNIRFKNLLISYLEYMMVFDSNEMHFSSTEVILKIYNLILSSEKSFKEYAIEFIKYLLNQSEKLVNGEKIFYLSKDKDIKLHLLYCLKFSFIYDLKDELNNLLNMAKRYFSYKDTEYIDLLLENSSFVEFIDLKELQYIHKFLMAFKELTGEYYSNDIFDSSFNNYLVNKIKQNTDLILETYEYYSNNIKAYKNVVKIYDKIKIFKDISLREYQTKDLVGTLILAIDIAQRLLGTSHQNNNFSLYFSKLLNIEFPQEVLKLYQQINNKLKKLNEFINEAYSTDLKYLMYDLFERSFIVLENTKDNITISQLVNLYRIYRCYDFLYDIEKAILDKKESKYKSTVIDRHIKIDSEKIYDNILNSQINIIDKKISSRYSEKFHLKRIEKLGDCFDYLCNAESHWKHIYSSNQELLDYTPYVTNYIKLVEKIIKEIIINYITRKRKLGTNILLKNRTGKKIDLLDNSETYFLTMGDYLKFIKNHDDIIVFSDKKNVFDYLYYFKNKIRNSKFHTSHIELFNEVCDIRETVYAIIKRILVDLY